MIGPLAVLLSRNGLIAAGSAAAVTLTGAGGYLSGIGHTSPPVVRVAVPPPVTKVHRVTVVKPSRTIIIRRPLRPHPAAQPPPAAPGTPGAPVPGVTRTATVTVTTTRRPPVPCDQPPGWCRTTHTPRPAPSHP